MKAASSHLLAITTTIDEITGEPKPLFSFPIQVCSAAGDTDVKFDIAAPSGAPRKQVYVDESTGEVCEDDACPRGIRIGDVFHPIPADAIEQINTATKIPVMVALGVIDLADVPFDRSVGQHFLQSPVKGGVPKAYRLVYEALRAIPKGKDKRPARAIVTKRTARSRQKLAVIFADEQRECLMLNELRFADQVREPDEQILAPQQAIVDAAQVEMARTVIDGLGDGNLAIQGETDDAIVLKRTLIEQAVAGEALDVPATIGDAAPTDDISALLEASLAAVGSEH